MALDPFSRTLVSDWAEALAGHPLPEKMSDGLNKWFKDKESSLTALRRIDIANPDYTVLAQVGPQTKGTIRRYRIYASYKDGPFIDTGTLRRNKKRSWHDFDKRMAEHLAPFNFEKPLKDHSTRVVQYLPWRFLNIGTNGSTSPNIKITKIAEEIDALVRMRAKKLSITSLRHSNNNEEFAAKRKAAIAELKKALHQRLRKPEVEAAKNMQLDGTVFKAGGRRPNNRLYAWIMEANEPHKRLWRAQFTKTFSSFCDFKTLEVPVAKELELVVDKGIRLFSGEGLDALATVFNRQKKISVSAETVRLFITMPKETIKESLAGNPQIFLPLLDKIPFAHWPRTAKGLIAMEKILGGIPEIEANVRTRLIAETGADWDGLYHAAEKAVMQRLVATQQTNDYRAAAKARAEGKPIPEPRSRSDIQKTQQVKTSDIAQIVLSLRDYIRLVSANTIGAEMVARRMDLSEADIVNLKASAPLRQLIAASEAWHEPRRSEHISTQLAALRPREETQLNKEQKWLPLIDPVTIPAGTSYNGIPIGRVQLIELTSKAMLEEEGKAMHHCVGGYSSTCLTSNKNSWAGSAHIISVRDAHGARLSTIHIGETGYQDKPVQMHANLGLSDRQPSAVAIAVGQWLVANLENGNIKEASTVAERDSLRTYRSALTGVEFDARDPELRRQAFEICRQIFPPAWRHCENGMELMALVHPQMAPAETWPQPDNNIVQINALPRPPNPVVLQRQAYNA